MKNARLWITVGTGLLFVVAAFTIRRVIEPDRATAPAPADYARIVSLAPSMTETLFALGLGERVVGVTRYCSYPPETAELPQVGGFTDLDKEAVIRLKPDLLVTQNENDEAMRLARALGIPILAVRHATLDEILEAIRLVGHTCRAEDAAKAVIDDINARIERLRRRTRTLDRPRVLIVIGRERGGGTLRDVTVAGKDALYDRMLEIAGATNACEQSLPAYPALGAETILRMNPDVIIELAGSWGTQVSPETIRDDWRALPDLAAMENDRVIVLTEDYLTKPGPRVIDAIERLARALHPEIDAEAPPP